MNKRNLILIGAGGHCKACIDVIEAENKFTIKGILEVEEKVGQQVLGYPIIGTDDDIVDLVKEGYSFLISLGQIKSSAIRKNIYNHLESLHANMATVVSPYAVVSKYAQINEGTIVMHGAAINAGAKIGANCIINTGCIIEHDANVGKHCHISTNAVLNGEVVIADDVFIGSGTVISNNVKIASNVVIGAGSLVLKNIHQSGIFVGQPVKRIDYD